MAETVTDIAGVLRKRAADPTFQHLAPNLTKELLTAAEALDANPGIMQDDLTELMEVAGIATHARPVSPHKVMQDEVIPWVKRAAWTYRYVEALEKRLTPEQIDAAVQGANDARR